MTRPLISVNCVDAIALPRIVRLRSNLIALAFPLMKLLPARFMIRKAAEERELKPGGMIIETTSGTFGLALAMVAKLQGYRLTLVSDPALDWPLRRRLEDLGAQVNIIRQTGPSGGYQEARLQSVEKLLRENPGSYCPQQYSNPYNPGSYAPCAELLTHAAGAIDCLIGTVGSGGSVCGIAGFLRLALPELTVVGVDSHGSVIFGQSDAGIGRMLRGLGNSLMPPNVDHTAFDYVHWVGAADAFWATRQLHRDHALFMGPTSGAAYLVADWWAREHPDSLTAVLLPDEGYRYQQTVYVDTWLEKKGLLLNGLPREPIEWDRPQKGEQAWSYCRWGRRSYDDALGTRREHLQAMPA